MRLLLAVLVLAATSLGELLPSFFADDVAWGATHIVVATEGKTIDGKFTILENLAGNLEIGGIDVWRVTHEHEGLAPFISDAGPDRVRLGGRA